MDWVFFADKIYDSFNGILFTLFNAIYGDFSVSLKVVLNSLFHFFIVVYAFLAIKSGVVASVFSVARTIALLLITFHLSFNYSAFKSWVFEFIIDFPADVASYFVSSTISSLIPGFKPPEAFSTSEMFAELSNVLINRAKASAISKMGISIPSFESFYLYFIVILVAILYFAFWIIQFNFLVQVSIYLIIGIPVLILASFRETQQIFFEWLRAVVTLMLYPILSSIIMFLILNMILPLTSDIKNILNDSHVGLSATGTLFVVLIFGIYSMRFIPSMAAVLTRGHMTTGNPVQFAKDAATGLAGRVLGGASSFGEAFKTKFGSGRLDNPAFSNSPSESKKVSVTGANKDTGIQTTQNTGSESGPQALLPYYPDSKKSSEPPDSNPYQVLPPAVSNQELKTQASNGSIKPDSSSQNSTAKSATGFGNKNKSPADRSPLTSPTGTPAASFAPKDGLTVPVGPGASTEGAGSISHFSSVTGRTFIKDQAGNNKIKSPQSAASADAPNHSQAMQVNKDESISQSHAVLNTNQQNTNESSHKQETHHANTSNRSRSQGTTPHFDHQSVSPNTGGSSGPSATSTNKSQTETVRQSESSQIQSQPSGERPVSFLPKNSPLQGQSSNHQPVSPKKHEPKIDVKD